MRPARLGITVGDPRGIGPEVADAALEALASRPELELRRIGDWSVPFDGSESDAGRVAAESIVEATHLALDGELDGIVTAPIHKPALQAAGHDFPGHTEMLASLSGTRDVGMLMAAEQTRSGGPLRVLLATTHLALRDVPSVLTSELLVRQTALLHEALIAGWRIADPKIALCAFNPHASDGGLFGDEEARIYAPAIETLTSAGVVVSGPHPADTVFSRAIAGEFDAVVAPYHDVGMAAFKTTTFGQGVNVTLGLPFVRTSPDHGTAFDLVGTGRADAGSMRQAIETAARLVLARFDRTAAEA